MRSAMERRSESEKADKIYCAPGNAGIAAVGRVCADQCAMEFDKLAAFAKEHAG